MYGQLINLLNKEEILKFSREYFVYTPVQGSDSKAQIYIG